MNLQFLSKLNPLIGLDIGTSQIRIWSEPHGLVVNEPSCIAVDKNTHKVIAVGQGAQEIQGRLQDTVLVQYPIRHGLVEDADLLEAMLKVHFQKVVKTSFFFRPTLLVSVPSSITEPEKIALTEVLFNVGVREVNFVDQLLAAAIGSGVPIADASGSFMMQLGAGLVETGIISLGSIVVSESVPEAGEYIDTLIHRFLKKELQLLVGIREVEKIKQKLLAVVPTEAELLVKGKDMGTGVPKEIQLSSQHLVMLLDPLLLKYVSIIKKVFEQVPPELVSDVVDKGILLSGGMAQLQGLDTYLLNKIGIPVTVVDEPEQVVIKGIAQVLQNLELFRQSIGYHHESYQNG